MQCRLLYETRFLDSFSEKPTTFLKILAQITLSSTSARAVWKYIQSMMRNRVASRTMLILACQSQSTEVVDCTGSSNRLGALSWRLNHDVSQKPIIFKAVDRNMHRSFVGGATHFCRGCCILLTSLELFRAVASKSLRLEQTGSQGAQ